MREKLAPLGGGDYPRPQQTWQCGLADEGPPCPLGPDGSGHCPAAAACRPVRDGDRWRCNRSELRGGACEHGPTAEGKCPIVYECTPVRSLRSRRGRVVAATALAVVGALAMMLSGRWRNDWIAAGTLSQAHAQLMQREGTEPQCAACHAAGGATLGEWWSHTIGRESLGPTQSTLCLKCHGKEFAEESALYAHNWPEGKPPASALEGERAEGKQDRRRDPAEPIACAACHHEHRGTKHDLTALGNAACQACHRQRFTSFAVDHPDFGGWPHATPTRITFSHATHVAKHFPAEKREFACAMCHAPDATGVGELTASYEATCAECHDKALLASISDGVPLVALPTLDVDLLAEAGRDVGPWPAAASGDFEGTIPAAMQLLLAADSQAASALEKLGPGFDFFDLDIDDPAQLAAAAEIAAATKRLVADLAESGQAAIGDRLSVVLGRPIAAAELAKLASGLSPDTAGGFRDQWFPVASGAPATEGGDRAAQRARVAAGGWLRDDATLSLRRQTAGHADPWMTAWLDTLAEAAQGEHAKIAEPLLAAALKPTAPGQCGSCHALRKEPGVNSTIAWRALKPADEPRGLTFFSHGPHLTESRLRDCASCHQVAAVPPADAKPTSPVADFSPLSKALCAECHIERAAGESCQQCHTYHTHGR